MDHRWLVLVVSTLAICYFDKSSASDDEERLVKEILSKYNRLIRPVKHINESVKVEFALILSLLINVQEQRQIMKTNVWLQFKWWDPQLIWDPASYGGIQSIRLPFDKIWMPDIVLINNWDGKYTESYRSNLVVYSDGNLLLLPPSIFQSTCDIKVHNFPFDQQTCLMKFQSWTYNADEVNIVFADGQNQSEVDMTSYQKSGTWYVVGRTGYRSHYRKSDQDPWQVDVTYHIQIRRKTLFYLINLVIPTVLVSFLSVLVFYLPTVAGEKVALSISILLTLNVFLLLVSKLLPPAEDLPLIGKYLLFTFLMNLVSIVITVITINLNFRSPKTHMMPVWVRKIFLHYMPLILGMRRPRRPRRIKFNNNSGARPTATATGDQRRDLERRSPRPGRTPGGSPERMELRELMEYPAGRRTLAHGPAAGTSAGDEHEPFGASRGDGGRDEDATLSSPDAKLVTNSIAYIVQYHQHNDALQEVEEDWKYIALVVDRLLLWIFFLATTLGSIKILLSADTLFDSMDESKWT